MEHSAYKELLSALLDGELDDASREQVTAHLAECADCQAYFAELTALHDALGALDEVDVPDGFAEGVMERVRAERTNKRKTRRVWRGWTTLAACAAVAVLAVGLLPRGGSSAPKTAESTAPRMAVTAAAPAAASAASAETAEEAAPQEESLETQMLFMTGGTANEAIEEAKDMLVAADAETETVSVPMTEPTAAYGGYTGEAAAGEAAAGEAAAGEAAAGEAEVERTLIGVDASAWLAEHGWQGESGDWYADAAALRALPEGLSLTEPLDETDDGAVRVTPVDVPREAPEEPAEAEDAPEPEPEAAETEEVAP